MLTTNKVEFGNSMSELCHEAKDLPRPNFLTNKMDSQTRYNFRGSSSNNNKRTASLDRSPNNEAKKKSVGFHQNPPQMGGIKTQNYYENLSDEEMNVDVSPASTSSAATNSAFRPPLSKPKTTPARKPKPFIITKTTFEATQTMLKNLNIKSVIQKMRSGAPTSASETPLSSFQVFPNNMEEKKKIRAKLDDIKVQFHTFSEPEERNLVFVIKNHYRIDPEGLLEILKDEKIPAIKVRFVFDHPTNPIYLILFEKGATTFNQLKHQHQIIGSLKIVWERYDASRKRPTQCSRCQRWGHSSTNCGHQPRCIKCLLDHKKGECARKDKESGLPSCVNCQKEGHPSNSPNCESYQKYMRNIQSRRQSAPARTFTSTRAPWASVSPNTNFSPTQDNFPINTFSSQKAGKSQAPNVNERADMSPSSSNQSRNFRHTSDSYSQFADLQNEFNEIPGISEAVKIYADLIAKLKSAPNPISQARILVNFMGLSP